jgi:hypothetical protein
MFDLTFDWRVDQVKRAIKGVKHLKMPTKDRGAIIPSQWVMVLVQKLESLKKLDQEVTILVLL